MARRSIQTDFTRIVRQSITKIPQATCRPQEDIEAQGDPISKMTILTDSNISSIKRTISLLEVTNIQVVHFLYGYLRVNGLFESLSRVLSALRGDDPPPSWMFQHELGEIVDAVFDDQPAVAHLAVLADLLPGVLRGHRPINYKII